MKFKIGQLVRVGAKHFGGLREPGIVLKVFENFEIRGTAEKAIKVFIFPYGGIVGTFRESEFVRYRRFAHNKKRKK